MNAPAMSTYLTSLLALIVLFLLGPRPRLQARPPKVSVPDHLSLPDLAHWLSQKEERVTGLIDGADARIEFANPDAPAKTALCFVYIHGFSATWQETHPVTTTLASHFSANVLQARLAGHGARDEDMVTPAEQWLASMVETWQIASQLGEKVVLVATSTGAPLCVWLASLPEVQPRLQALLFMSPNFRVRTRFDFLLTAPWSKHWVPLIIGRHREWEPISEEQAKYWTYRYPTLALIEMQKVVDWAKGQDLAQFTTPLAVMYMKNDPTIDPDAAVDAFNAWGGEHKALIPVTIEGEAAEHVFAGDITGPQRTNWCVAQFAAFLETLATPA